MAQFKQDTPTLTDEDIFGIQSGEHPSPWSVLGPHSNHGQTSVVTFQPEAVSVAAICDSKPIPLQRVDGDLFEGTVTSRDYLLTVQYADGSTHSMRDPFSFGPVLSELDQYLIGEGKHKELWRALGANVMTHQGVDGVHFAVWAPNAKRVSVIGDFNIWDGRRHPMRTSGETGVWEIFVPGLGEGQLYKFQVTGADGVTRDKADPVGFGSQHPPEQASVVRKIADYKWQDSDWMKDRANRTDRSKPISIYVVHL